MNNFKPVIMKKAVIVLLLISALPVIGITAQNSNLERLNNFKIAFFTKKLNLTSQEAEKFWPVYNEYQGQRNTIQLEKFKILRNFNQNESELTNEQLSGMGDKLVSYIAGESSLAIAFHKKLKEVLPPAKVIRYYQAENQYKIQLLKELQDMKQQKGRMPVPDF